MSKIVSRHEHADEVVADAVKFVSTCTGVSEPEIYGKCRLRRIVTARQKAMHIAHMRGVNYCQIGRVMGRNHSTIRHACKKMGVA